MTCLPSSASVLGTQARQVSPSMSTVQAPQAPSEQPSFTEVSWSSSRKNRSRVWFFLAVTACPFTKNVAIVLL